MSLQPTYQVTTAPAGAVTVFGLPNEFLRLAPGQEDATVNDLLDAVIEIGETRTNRVFRLTSFTAEFPCFTVDPSMAIRRPFVEIGRSPLIDVQEMRVIEEGNVSATVVVPEIVRRPGFSRVFLPKGTELDVDPEQFYPIEVDFRAGYSVGTPTFPELQIPGSLRVAIQQHVAYLFENRGDVKGEFSDAMPDEVERSYARIRIPLGAG